MERQAEVKALIAKKRHGKTLSAEEISYLVDGFASGRVPDYQMAAWAMAVCCQGMSDEETTALTRAMRDSGVVLTNAFTQPAVDKHSTGGVGDKVSICLAPWVAACGLRVPMIAGRGLGHTGGTVDKLESIPGFRTNLSQVEFVSQVQDLGLAVIGQTAEFAPADRMLYALRDVTGTVESEHLITASILSKKLAEGINGLVMDVKVGSGAFMKSLDEARSLARSLERIGRQSGCEVRSILTRMDTPLGRTVGNAIEVREAFDLLCGQADEQLYACTEALGVAMLCVGGIASTESEARILLRDVLKSGKAKAKAKAWVKAQGGDERVVDLGVKVGELAPTRLPVVARRTGFMSAAPALPCALLALELGAGRALKDDVIDHRVGIEFLVPPGHALEDGQAFAVIHASDARGANRVAARLAELVEVRDTPPSLTSVLVEQSSLGPQEMN